MYQAFQDLKKGGFSSGDESISFFFISATCHQHSCNQTQYQTYEHAGRHFFDQSSNHNAGYNSYNNAISLLVGVVMLFAPWLGESYQIGE
ncbi:MAG: hypothetical protein WDM78_03560 [Puia sp.]